MQPKDLLPLQSGVPSQFSTDMIVVGAGLAGLQVARDLWARGAKVVVLEAGPIGELSHINKRLPASDVMHLWLQARTYDPAFRIAWRTQAAPHYDGYSGLRQVVGGRSLYWHGAVLPIESWALEDKLWPDELRNDLTRNWHGGRGLYDQVLTELREWSRNNAETYSVHEPLVDLLRSFGYDGAIPVPHAVRRYDQIGRWSAYSPLDILLTEAADEELVRNRGALPIIYADTAVSRLRYNSKSSQKIQLDVISKGNFAHINASTVILAAGTIENTRLVAQCLNDLGELKTATHFNLFDHIVQGFVAQLPKRLINTTASGTTLSAMVPGDGVKRSNLFVSAALADAAWFIDAWEMGEQLPRSESWVEIPDTSLPLVHVGLSSEDIGVIETQKETLNQLWSYLAAATEVHVPPLMFESYGGSGNTYAELVSRGGLEFNRDTWESRTYYCPLGTVDHEGGTLPYGMMLDNKARIRGLEHILVVGPASFPRMGAANPSLTTITLARRAALLM